MTSSIQPPVLAWAWRIAVGDPARGARHRPPARVARAPTATSTATACIWIVSAGRVGSRRLAAVRRDLGPARPRAARAIVLLVRRNRRLGYDAAPDRGRRRAGLLRGDDQRPLLAVAARARAAVADPGDRRADVRRATRPVLAARAARPDAGPALTWAALSPLALPDLPEEIGRRLVEEHLLDPKRFWLAGPADRRSRLHDPASRSRTRTLPGSRRYWRGPDVDQLGVAACGSGCVRLGYDEQAAELADAASERGRHEPGCASTTTRTAARAWARPTSRWSALVMEMIDARTRAPRRATWQRTLTAGAPVFLGRSGVAVERLLDLFAVGRGQPEHALGGRRPARSARSARGRASSPRP